MAKSTSRPKKRVVKAQKSGEKELAYAYYMEGEISQKEICARIGIAPNTLTRWIHEGDWELVRTANSVTRGQQQRSFLNQISELNQRIADRPAGERFPSASEADTITKLSKAVRDLDKKETLIERVAISKEIIGWISERSLEEAKKFIVYVDEYLQSAARNLK